MGFDSNVATWKRHGICSHRGTGRRASQTEAIMAMDIRKVTKVVTCGMYAALGTAGVSILATPVPAMAAVGGQYGVSEMLNNAGRDAGVQPTVINGSTVTYWVNGIASWAVRIAVAFFVLRIVLTAIDRFVLANSNTTAHVPLSYPNPGDERYDENDVKGNTPPEGWTWKRIWINFGKNLGILAGAWLIVQLIMGIIQMVSNAAVSSGTNG